MGNSVGALSTDFNPLSPHGERLVALYMMPKRLIFQSTLPAWGETFEPYTRKRKTKISIHSPRMGRDAVAVVIAAAIVISIHSPRMGRDCTNTPKCPCIRYFNPLSPHGERHILDKYEATKSIFQSTLPAWGETTTRSTMPDSPKISIHSPRMGRDLSSRPARGICCNFNPLSPHGERR